MLAGALFAGCSSATRSVLENRNEANMMQQLKVDTLSGAVIGAFCNGFRLGDLATAVLVTVTRSLKTSSDSFSIAKWSLVLFDAGTEFTLRKMLLATTLPSPMSAVLLGVSSFAVTKRIRHGLKKMSKL